MKAAELSRPLALLLLLIGAALAYGSGQHRGRARLPLLKTHRRIQVARFAALFAVELARTSLARVETGAAAYLVGGAGFLVLAPAVTLIAPLAPRSFWTSVGAAALLAGALVAWEWLS